MRKIAVFSTTLLTLSFLTLVFLGFSNNILAKRLFEKSGFSDTVDKGSSLVFNPGERLEFEVKLYGVKLGKTILCFLGETQVDDKKAFLIESSTNTLNFKGKEMIYTEREHFYPLLVDRDISLGWKKELIKERYDLNKYQVEIINQSAGKTNTRLISKNSPIQNSVSMLYFLRQIDELAEGKAIKINLPTKEYNLIVGKKVKVKVPCGEFAAVIVEDKKGAFKVWLSADAKRLPLRFEYSNLMQKYTTELISYE